MKNDLIGTNEKCWTTGEYSLIKSVDLSNWSSIKYTINMSLANDCETLEWYNIENGIFCTDESTTIDHLIAIRLSGMFPAFLWWNYLWNVATASTQTNFNELEMSVAVDF